MFKEYVPRKIIKLKPWMDGILIVISIVGLYLEEKNGHISLGSNAYPSPGFMIISTMTGLLLLFALSNLFGEISKLVSGVLAYIGQHTMFILFLHFASFKIVNLIQVWVYQKEWYELATFPILETGGAWWILYTIVGITIPIMINCGWDQVKRLILKIDKKTSKEYSARNEQRTSIGRCIRTTD